MFQVKSPIPDHLADFLEAHFCEAEAPQRWSIESIPGGRDFQLYGFFDNPEQAREGWASLRTEFPEIPEAPEGRQLADRDWKNAYREHFRPWTCQGLHWVPVWERGSYTIPPGEQALYLDPGMAFGTGNHATTRLCVEGLLNYSALLKQEELATSCVVDAGCGSGILALSAWLMGFRNVSAFDIDGDSIRICHENAAMNQLERTVEFTTCGLDAGIPEGGADILLANILANVLTDNCATLLRGLRDRPGSTLVLSGILQGEMDAVQAAYLETAAAMQWPFEVTRTTLGQWGCLTLARLPKPTR